MQQQIKESLSRILYNVQFWKFQNSGKFQNDKVDFDKIPKAHVSSCREFKTKSEYSVHQHNFTILGCHSSKRDQKFKKLKKKQPGVRLKEILT